MKRNILALATIASLAGCSNLTQKNITHSTAFQNGQLFCAMATANGPLIVALENATGVPVNVINKSSALVAASCAAWNALAIPVTPPANATKTTVPIVATQVPKT